MVDSPTPTVPMVSDSTRRISSGKPLRVSDRAAAVIQPAVPPPISSTRLMHLSDMVLRSPHCAFIDLSAEKGRGQWGQSSPSDLQRHVFKGVHVAFPSYVSHQGGNAAL